MFLSTQLQQNVNTYAGALKLQKGYEETCKSPGKYYICGGDEKTRNDMKKNYSEVTSVKHKDTLSEEEFQEIQNQGLGLVGTHTE